MGLQEELLQLYDDDTKGSTIGLMYFIANRKWKRRLHPITSMDYFSCIERSLIGKNCYLVKGNPLVSGWDDPYSWAAGKCLLIVGTWVGIVRFREGVRVR